MALKKVKNFWNSLEGVTTISKREVFLGMTTCTLAGIVLGIVLFPRHMMIGSNNGNHSGNNESMKDCCGGKEKHKKDKAKCGEKQTEEDTCCKKHKKHEK